MFKLPVHIATDPIVVELPLLGGSSKLSVGSRQQSPQEEYAAIIARHEAAPAEFVRYDDRLDYAAALVFSGRAREAIAVLQQLEADFPDRYATASTLGTAYELVDDLPNAIIWITAGMKRNAESHEGTEWLHLAILETKVKLKTDPAWLRTHSVMDGQRQRSSAAIEKAMEYQLNERLYFIKSDDPVMCDLFFEAAKATSNTDKRAYFLRQTSRFGHFRDYEMQKLFRRSPST